MVSTFWPVVLQRHAEDHVLTGPDHVQTRFLQVGRVPQRRHRLAAVPRDDNCCRYRAVTAATSAISIVGAAMSAPEEGVLYLVATDGVQRRTPSLLPDTMCATIAHMVMEWEQLGARLRESRIGRGVSQEHLASRMGIDRTALAKTEHGSRKLSAIELATASEALNVPMTWLVAEPIPTLVSGRTSLEEDPSIIEKGAFGADVLLDERWRQVQMLHAIGVLESVSDVPSRMVFSREDALELAREARHFGGYGDEPLPGMADVAATFGLHLAVADVGIDGVSMTPEAGLGVAVIGSTGAPGRRRMTAAHELGHHLLGDEYTADLSVSASRSEREQLIDAFASEFMLPQTVIETRVSGTGALRRSLIEVAGHYRVSWSVAVRAALTVGAIDDRTRSAWTLDRPTRGDFVAVLGADVPEDLHVGQISADWMRGVLEAYRHGWITAARAIEMLGADDWSLEALPAVHEPLP